MTQTATKPTWAIEKDGYFFRAVNGSFRSSAFTSASQAGLFIERKAGKEAHANAALASMGDDELWPRGFWTDPVDG